MEFTPGPWTWRDGEGNIVDVNNWASPGYCNNLHLCGPGFSQEPGEYSYVNEFDEVIGCDEYNIVNGMWGKTKEKAAANARLIASAPEGYKLARAVVDLFENEQVRNIVDNGEVLELARSIIQKVEKGEG